MVNGPNRASRLNTTNSTDSAAELSVCLQQQNSVFENAVALLERLERTSGSREFGNPDSVVQLRRTLDQVVEAQQKVAAAHSRFIQSRASLSSDVRQSLARHEQILKNLVTRIDHLQELFEATRADLTPSLDSDSRQRNMQAAYRQSLKSV